MLVKNAIDQDGKLVAKLPWISSLSITKIVKLSANAYRITLINGANLTAEGADTLEDLKLKTDRKTASRHESAEDYRSRQGYGRISREDWASYQRLRRNRV